MTLDDRAADGEADAHSLALCREERVKQALRIFSIEAYADIPYGYAQRVASAPLDADQHVSRTIVDGAHRIRGVVDEIQDDLLKLDAIANDFGQVVRELSPQITPFA